MEAREYEVMFAAESRHWWFLGSRRVVLDVLERALPARSRPLRVLDVGCGTGLTLGLLDELEGVEASGLDRETAALTFCRQRGLRRLARGSMDALPYADDAFDGAVALDVVEHLDDDVAALRELGRVVRPGGLVAVTVPAHPWLWSKHDEALHHRRRYSRAALQEALSASGLRTRSLTYYNAALFGPIAAVRLAGRVAGFLAGALSGGDDRTPHSDVQLPSRALNVALRELFSLERFWLRRAALPFGVSLLAVAEVPSC